MSDKRTKAELLRELDETQRELSRVKGKVAALERYADHCKCTAQRCEDFAGVAAHQRDAAREEVSRLEDVVEQREEQCAAAVRATRGLADECLVLKDKVAFLRLRESGWHHTASVRLDELADRNQTITRLKQTTWIAVIVAVPSFLYAVVDVFIGVFQ